MGGGSSKASPKAEPRDEKTERQEKDDEATLTEVTKIDHPPVLPNHVIILFGPPGAGKGTHSPYIEKCLDVPVLSTGNMLRAAVAAGTDVGKRAKEVMESGGLVSDELVMEVVSEAIAPLHRGYMLDGFPRTVNQNNLFQKHLQKTNSCVSAVFYFSVPDEVLEERILGRWVHAPSGRSYHTTNAKPQSLISAGEGAVASDDNMLDDETNEPLSRRKDDNHESLRKRLQAYHEQTTPILDFYRDPETSGEVYEVNCNASIEAVHLEIERHVASVLGVEDKAVQEQLGRR